jgi:exodeoxyribonuclease V beta subunit
VSASKKFNLAETPLKRGTSLIEASAGTGKTYAITALFVRLIVEENLSVREILAVTYTVAATEELRHRVRRSLVQALQGFASGTSDVPFLKALVDKYRQEASEMEARLQNALWDFDEAPIYTIHGFCQRTLRDRAFESGVLFDTELVTDPSDFLQEIADDFWRKHFYETGPTLVNFALKNKFGPDRFVGLLLTCLNYPQIEFISQAKGHSLESLSTELENGYQSAKDLWLSELDAIKACFGSATKWSNTPYNKDEKMAPLFDQLDTCFSESETAFEAYDCLQRFRTTVLAENKSRRAKEPVPQHRFFELCEKVCQAEQFWLAGLQLAFVDYARRELPRRKAERKIQYYDDLLTRLNDALAGPAGESLGENLRGRYKAALIDEFQDTDPVQYQIFRRAFSGGTTFLFLIGDPKQAIYGFRGADIFTYLEAAGEATGRFTLGENWRSESGLVTAVNKIFSAAPKAFVFDRIGFQEAVPKGQADKEPLMIGGTAKPPFQFWFWKRNDLREISKALATKTLPCVVASEIVRLLNGDVQIGGRKLKPEDIAVLVLENKQAAKVQEALSVFNVPSVLYTTASLFESREALEFRRVLAGIALPGDERLVKSALATDLFGVDGCRLAACSESQWQEWLQRFHEYLDLWERQGFFRMFRRWLQAEQVRQRLLAFPNGERRLTNVLHLGEVIHQAETERRLGISGALKWFAEQMDPDKETAEEHELRLERDENAVRLVTVHKSKGLEYPVVFCVFSWKGSEIKRWSEITRRFEEQVFFHDPKKHLQLVRDLGPEIDEEHRRLAKEEKLAENVRLLYVALTRAKHRCHFLWGGIKDAGTSAPAWLFHRPAVTAGPVLDSLKANFESLSDQQMLQDLEGLGKSSSGTLQISDLPERASDLYQPQDTGSSKLECREFKGRIQRDWVISSFTYFKAGIHEELPDRDNISPAKEEQIPGEGIFAFPRGAKAGVCLHEILEKLDFTSGDEPLIKLVNQRLQAHDLAQSGHAEAVSRMLRNLLKLPLATGCPDFNLAQISLAERLSELEFYFPVQGVSPARLHDLLGKSGWSSATPVQLGRLAFDPIKGFLKGFIDLVFRFEDRFYVVDWKSNWLGNRVEDYSPAAIKEEMQRQRYFLQYHLYTVASHKYLSLRVPGYDYEKHFGGVLYLFLRGLDPARPEYGAYRDRPALRVVNQLSTLLEGK